MEGGVRKKKKKKKKKLVFWLQTHQPRVFELKCADTIFSLQESTQVFPHE